MTLKYAILVVDQSLAARVIRKWFFGGLGYPVDAVQDADQAMLWLRTNSCHVMLVEARPEDAGMRSLAQRARAYLPSVKVVMLTSEPADEGLPCDLAVTRTTHLLELRSVLDGLMQQFQPGVAGRGEFESPAISLPTPPQLRSVESQV